MKKRWRIKPTIYIIIGIVVLIIFFLFKKVVFGIGGAVVIPFIFNVFANWVAEIIQSLAQSPDNLIGIIVRKLERFFKSPKITEWEDIYESVEPERLKEHLYNLNPKRLTEYKNTFIERISHNEILNDSSVFCFVFYGPPDIGKTREAAEFCPKLSQHCRAERILLPKSDTREWFLKMQEKPCIPLPKGYDKLVIILFLDYAQSLFFPESASSGKENEEILTPSERFFNIIDFYKKKMQGFYLVSTARAGKIDPISLTERRGGYKVIKLPAFNASQERSLIDGICSEKKITLDDEKKEMMQKRFGGISPEAVIGCLSKIREERDPSKIEKIINDYPPIDPNDARRIMSECPEIECLYKTIQAIGSPPLLNNLLDQSGTPGSPKREGMEKAVKYLERMGYIELLQDGEISYKGQILSAFCKE